MSERIRYNVGLWDGLLLVVLAALILWPAIALFGVGQSGAMPVGGGGLLDAFGLQGTVRPLELGIQTLKVSALALGVAVPAGVVLALLLFRTDLANRGAILWLLGVSVLVPMPLHALAWLGALGNAGRAQFVWSRPLLAGWTGAGIVHGLALLPWVVMLTGAGLRAVSSRLEEAALLDMPARRVVWVVTLRRCAGAIAGSALAVLVLTAGDMTVTDLLQVRTYAEEAYMQAQLGAEPARLGAVALPPVLAMGLLVWLAAWWWFRLDPSRRGEPRGATARIWRLGRWRWPLSGLVSSAVVLVMGFPLAGLAWRAGRVSGSAIEGRPPSWSASGLAGTLWRAWPDLAEPSVLGLAPWESPLVATFAWAVLASTGAVILAGGVAWKARGSRAWRIMAATLVALLLATPGPVAGLALKIAMIGVPMIHDTSAIVVLALLVRVLPYALLVMVPAARAVPEALLEAAKIDGLGPRGRLLAIAAPMSKGPLMASWLACFVLAFGELPASNLVMPPGRSSIPLRLWGLLHTGVDSHLAGVGLILIAIYGAAGLLGVWLFHGTSENTESRPGRLGGDRAPAS